jgi:DNA-binding response OmpR family regulator
MSEKVLVVEDEATLQETLVYNLKHQGYEVETAGDGNTALDVARKTHPDLILLDVMLPGIDGFEVCRILRQETNIPILMLTARDDEIDRVVGLEIGADDYITKPFSMRELIARIKARLRVVRMMQETSRISTPSMIPAPQPQLTFGNLELDLIRREVRQNGQVIPVKPKEYELLVFLAQHQGQALSREYILQQVWGWDFTGDSRTVDVHVRWLREKIEPDPAAPQRILTVRGAGYRFDG